MDKEKPAFSGGFFSNVFRLAAFAVSARFATAIVATTRTTITAASAATTVATAAAAHHSVQTVDVFRSNFSKLRVLPAIGWLKSIVTVSSTTLRIVPII